MGVAVSMEGLLPLPLLFLPSVEKLYLPQALTQAQSDTGLHVQLRGYQPPTPSTGSGPEQVRVPAPPYTYPPGPCALTSFISSSV